jgi:light-regulated signal transduction histidine kinase (bacteriophytochrome)
MDQNVSATEQALRQKLAELESRVQEQAAELAAAQQETASISSAISHDLRGALRIIDGFAKVLLEDHQTALPEEASRLVRVIVRNTANMEAQIEGLVTLMRAARAVPVFSDVDMGHMARDVLREVPGAHGPNLKIIMDDLPKARGDLAMMRQLWYILLSNAMKFSRRTPKPVIEIGYDVPGKSYFVRDNGSGFDMNYASRLFMPFHRMHAPGEYEGMGVGLCIGRRIVRLHSGTIWAESMPDKGATFSFTLAAP